LEEDDESESDLEEDSEEDEESEESEEDDEESESVEDVEKFNTRTLFGSADKKRLRLLICAT
jgi:hypothetical protein